MSNFNLSDRQFWFALAVLLAVYLTVAFIRLDAIPLLDPDEPRYAAAGRTMAEGGSWLVPEFNGQPRINKPPLFYWLVAVSDKLLGPATEITARLPSILCGLLMLGMTVYVARVVYGNLAAILACAVLSTTPLFLILCRTCITDMALSAFMTVALGFMMLGMLELRPPGKMMWLASFFLGLALLTKATPAFAVLMVLVIDRALVLPAEQRPRARLIVPLFAVATVFSLAGLGLDVYSGKLEARGIISEESGLVLDRILSMISLVLTASVVFLVLRAAWLAERGALAQMPWKAGLLLAVSLGAWWYAVLAVHLGIDEFWRLIKYEVGGRVAGSVHREPMHYYVPLLFGVTFPWSVGLIGALASAWPGRVESTAAQRADRFAVAWLLGIVFFFSIPGAKLATYIMPAMPAVALLIARYLQRLCSPDDQIARVWKRLTVATCLALGSILVVLGSAPQIVSTDYRDLLQKMKIAPWAVAVVFAGLVVAGWLLANAGRVRAATGVLVGTVLLIVFGSLPFLIDRLGLRSTRELCLRVKHEVADCERVASVGAEVESLSYYLDRVVHESRRRRVVKRRASSTAPIDPNEPPVTEDEPFNAVVLEELNRPMKVALFIQEKYYAKLLGVTREKIESMTPDEIARTVPAGAKFVGISHNIVVIKN